jgi:hypothetical protein
LIVTKGTKPVSVPDAAHPPKQVLRNLAAEHDRQLRQILQAGVLVKGSVYQIQTRCGPGLPLRPAARPAPSAHRAFLE